MRLPVVDNRSVNALYSTQIAIRNLFIENQVVASPATSKVQHGKHEMLPPLNSHISKAPPSRSIKRKYTGDDSDFNDGYGYQKRFLYHFTSANALPAIAACGLTIGDVPTSLTGNRGKIAIWLTQSTTPDGHGLEGASVDKKRVRLQVEVPCNLLLYRWNEWKKLHVEPSTIERLEQVAGAKAAPANWFLYFGWLRPELIKDAVDMTTSQSIAEWRHELAGHAPVEAVAYADRQRWHRKLLRDVRARLMR